MTAAVASRDSRRSSLVCAACRVPVRSSGLAVEVTDALCGVTPDSVHTLDPRRVEIGPTTGRLSLDRPGDRWLFFQSALAREAYLAMYGHRYDYTFTWSDAGDLGPFALEAVITHVHGGQGATVPSLSDLTCAGCNRNWRSGFRTVPVPGPYGDVDQTMCPDCAGRYGRREEASRR